MTAGDAEVPVITASAMATPWLVHLALNLPVAENGNELYGRDRAFYQLGHTLEAASAWIHAQPEPGQRAAAAKALAMAGHRLAWLETLPLTYRAGAR